MNGRTAQSMARLLVSEIPSRRATGKTETPDHSSETKFANFLVLVSKLAMICFMISFFLTRLLPTTCHLQAQFGSGIRCPRPTGVCGRRPGPNTGRAATGPSPAGTTASCTRAPSAAWRRSAPPWPAPPTPLSCWRTRRRPSPLQPHPRSLWLPVCGAIRGHFSCPWYQFVTVEAHDPLLFVSLGGVWFLPSSLTVHRKQI